MYKMSTLFNEHTHRFSTIVEEWHMQIWRLLSFLYQTSWISFLNMKFMQLYSGYQRVVHFILRCYRNKSCTHKHSKKPLASYPNKVSTNEKEDHCYSPNKWRYKRIRMITLEQMNNNCTGHVLLQQNEYDFNSTVRSFKQL